jgi:hypothetical protein
MHTQRRAIMKSRNNRTTVNSIRRDGLRSGGQLPPGSESGLKNERVLKQPEQPHQTRFKPVVKKKISKSLLLIILSMFVFYTVEGSCQTSSIEVILTLTLRMATVVVALGAFKQSVWDE